MYCNASNSIVREKTAELFGKILADKLVGPKVRILLTRFLPLIFMDGMRDSAEASVHMFEGRFLSKLLIVLVQHSIHNLFTHFVGSHQNPELIWNDEAREKVCELVKKMTEEFYLNQRDNPSARWNLPEDFSVVYTDVQGEMTIGGVFLRLYIANPGWVLRKPKEFIIELLERWSTIVSNNACNVSQNIIIEQYRIYKII